MATPAILHLGGKKVVTDPKELLRLIFVHAFLSDKDQVEGIDQIFSFRDIASKYGNDRQEMIVQLESELSRYLGRYFPEGAKVTVLHDESLDDIRYTLKVSARVVKDEVGYDWLQALLVDPSNTYEKLIEILP